MTTDEDFVRVTVIVKSDHAAREIYSIIKPYIACPPEDNTMFMGTTVWFNLHLPGEIALFLAIKYTRFIIAGTALPNDFYEYYNGIL